MLYYTKQLNYVKKNYFMAIKKPFSLKFPVLVKISGDQGGVAAGAVVDDEVDLDLVLYGFV